MTRYAVALGSNLGYRLENLRSAVSEIAGFVTELETSRLYESAPVGGPKQGPFLNAAVSFRSDLSPLELLGRLQDIENSHGRERVERWGPRTLDLDIIVRDAGPVDLGPELEVPHPRAGDRLFVVKPMLDIWPDAELSPGVCLDDVYHRVMDQKVDLVATTWLNNFGSKGMWLVMLQVILLVLIGILLVVDGSVPSQFEWPQIVALLAGIGGGLLIWRSAVALGSNLVPLPEPVAGGSLVETGPYRYVRHPIYAAIVLIFGGVALLFASWLAAVGTGMLYLLFAEKSGYEEGLLRVAYPEYQDYMKRVRLRIPFLR